MNKEVERILDEDNVTSEEFWLILAIALTIIGFALTLILGGLFG